MPGDHDTDNAGVAPNKVQHYLKGISYPASKHELVERAERNDAPDAVMTVIRRFHDGEYGGPQDVMKAFGDVSNEP